MEPSSTLLVVDCANINRSFQNNGDPALIDYRQMRNTLEAVTGGRITEAVACTFSAPVGDFPQTFAEHLKTAGFNTVTRGLTRVRNSSGCFEYRCNMDSEVVNEALLRAHAHDSVIIASGDADFIPLVKALQKDGKKVYAAANRQAFSNDLRSAVGFHRAISLSDYTRTLVYDKARPEPKVAAHPPIVRGIGDGIGNPPKSGLTTLLLDTQNIYMGVRTEGWNPDWKRIVAAAEWKFGELAPVQLFAREAGNAAMLDYFRRQDPSQWEIHSLKEKTDYTASASVEMACVAVAAAKRGDDLVFATGSGHMLPTIQRLRENGVAVGLMSPSSSLSQLMKDSFGPDEYYNMSAHRYELQHVPGNHRPAFHRPPLNAPSRGPSQQGHSL